MDIPVLIEPAGQDGYRATAARQLTVAFGKTKEEAVQRLREQLEARRPPDEGAGPLNLKPTENPWLAMAGMHDPNDPVVQEWKEVMAANRREEDQGQEAS